MPAWLGSLTIDVPGWYARGKGIGLLLEAKYGERIGTKARTKTYRKLCVGRLRTAKHQLGIA